MNCDEAKNIITIGAFGEPDPAEAADLAEHLRRCPSCARAWERTSVLRRSAEAPADFPKPDWNRSWDVISRRAFGRREKLRIFGLSGTWIFASAAILAVFILGFIAGRRFLKPGPEAVFSRSSVPVEATPFQAYADALEPILIDFLNRSAVPLPEETAGLRKRILRSMIEETRLLKDLAEKSGDAEWGGFLDELDNVLVSLSNLNPGDRESVDRLKQIIRNRGVRSKLRELSGAKISL